MNLYQIDLDLQAILNLTDESGELSDAQAKQIDSLQLDRRAKIDALLRFFANRKARHVGIVAEIDRLMAAAKTELNAMEWVNKYIFESMMRLGEQSIDTPLHRVRIQRNGQPSITIAVPVDQLPVAFLRIPPPEPDKKKMLAAWKEGQPLPDGVTVVQGYHLRVQ